MTMELMRRAVLVVGLDPLQVHADQRAAGQTAGPHRLVHLRDGRLLHFERRGFLSGKGKRQDEAGPGYLEVAVHRLAGHEQVHDLA